MKNLVSTPVFYKFASVSRLAALGKHLAKPRIKYFSRSFWSLWSFGAFLLAALNLHGQIYYVPNLFDISISFGCNCTCSCETNTVDTNNPVSVFLAANPVAKITSSAVMPALGQVVPPHWSEFLPSCDPNTVYGIMSGGSYNILYDPEGWTETVSRINAQGWTPAISIGSYNPNYPIHFNHLDYMFYADTLPSAGTGTGPDPVQSQTQCQPYPWDVNLMLTLQNNQLYYMEQQLVVGYSPLFDGQSLETPVDYLETNGLLTVSLYCTNGGVTNLLPVSTAYLTATLLPDNIPAPLSQSVGWVFTPNFYTNWAWPLTFADLTAPNSPYSPPGAAGTVQASLGLISGNIDHVNLLVRAHRAYKLDLAYYLNGYYIETLSVTNTGVVPPCTNVSLVFYTDICSITPIENKLCYATNVGKVEMMGAPNDPPGITIHAYGDYNNFYTTLTGSVLTPLPASYVLPVFLVNEGSDPNFEKWATESLGLNTAYEYFSSPLVFPLTEECSLTNDLGNDFVICPTNPATVMGNITLNGPVDPAFYSGVGALHYLQFATYVSGLPHDPTIASPADPTLQYVSSIQATNGASASLPFNKGGGQAITEFDNPGTVGTGNSYSGFYSLKLGGLNSQPSVWDVNDLHLVFGSPVNLDYHVIETNSPFTNVNISCGTILTNNIGLCFGLKRIQVINNYPTHPIPTSPINLIYTLANIHVSGFGPGYIVGPLDFNGVLFDTDPNNNHADVDLFLPEGTYQYIADVSIDGISFLSLGVTNQFTITCDTNPCLQVDCPTNIVITSCTNLPVYYYGLMVTDLCCSNWTVTYSPTNGSIFSPSTTNWVTCQVHDNCGNSNICQFTVTVLKPTNCPSCLQILRCFTNIVVVACSNVPVYYDSGHDMPTVSDPCCTNWPALISWTYNPADGSSFSPGTTTWVTATAHDTCGNTASCDFTVTVVKCVPPLIIWHDYGSNSPLIVAWPAWDTNYVLQTVTNLNSTNWVTVTNGAPVTGVSLPVTLPASFFRLQRNP